MERENRRSTYTLLKTVPRHHLGAYQLQQKKALIRKVKRCTRGIFSPFYMLMFP